MKMKRGNKKGQFYLIAALIIISIMVSFMAYQNKIRTAPVSYKIYDLGKELNMETAEVLDYGIYSNPAQQQTILNSWANNFSAYAGEKSEQEKFVFIYYDENANKFKGIEFSAGEGGCSSIGQEEIGTCTEITEVSDVPCTGTTTITCSIGGVGGTQFSFDSDDNFYFVIRGRGGEVAQR